MILYILRGTFLLLAASVTLLYVLSFQEASELSSFATVVGMVSLTLGIAGGIVVADSFIKRKKLSALSGVFMGLLGGLLVAYAMSFVVDLIGTLTAPEVPFERPPSSDAFDKLSESDQLLIAQYDAYMNLLEGAKVFIGLITCYLAMSFVIQTKDDFRFVVPYVEFSRQVRGLKSILLDSSVLIDGRIVDLIDTRIVQGNLVVPKFILNELQLVADSGDKLRRARGRRGLDVVHKLQANKSVQIAIDETEVDGPTVDQKLISLATRTQAQIMTNDFNLSKIADVRGVGVINLNDVAKSLRPVVLPGEKMTVKIVKGGESANQGVGYLEDGTMVVVENARRLMGKEVSLAVTSTLQTSAGRMIFGTHAALEAEVEDDELRQPVHADPPADGRPGVPDRDATYEQTAYQRRPSERNPRSG